jgi:hypothetical protein
MRKDSDFLCALSISTVHKYLELYITMSQCRSVHEACSHTWNSDKHVVEVQGQPGFCKSLTKPPKCMSVAHTFVSGLIWIVFWWTA